MVIQWPWTEWMSPYMTMSTELWPAGYLPLSNYSGMQMNSLDLIRLSALGPTKLSELPWLRDPTKVIFGKQVFMSRVTMFTVDSSDPVELVLLLNRLTLDNFGHLDLISFWYRFFLASWRMMRIDRAAFILSFKDFHFDASSLWRSLSFMLWCRKMTKSIIENAITFRKNRNSWAASDIFLNNWVIESSFVSRKALHVL